MAEDKIGAYEFLVGEEVRQAFQTTTSMSPETLNWIREMLTEKYGVTQF